jgi:hypothetical protein
LHDNYTFHTETARSYGRFSYFKAVKIKILLSILLPVLTAFAQKDTLYRACLDYEELPSFVEIGSPYPVCAYVDKTGKPIVKGGEYEWCLTTEFVNYAFVKPWGKEVVGIDRRGRTLFYPFFFDNWVDEPQEGLFRIRNKKGLVGYADETGKIVVKPQYSWGTGFYEGYARVTKDHNLVKIDSEHQIVEAEHWITIDRTGKVISEKKRTEER